MNEWVERVKIPEALSRAVASDSRQRRIRLTAPGHDLAVTLFLLCTFVLTVAAICALQIDWGKIAERASNLGEVSSKLLALSFDKFEITWDAFLESVAVTILATAYSLVAGLVLGALAARNITPFTPLAHLLSALFSFIRAVPTAVWVLLVLVCLGFGPAPGIVGLTFHATAFFARVFAQSFEEVPESTIEALKATGANRLQIIFGAVLPASLTSLIAWTALRFEINFGESAILGMVGAGGIGYTIMAAMTSYKFGRAGVAVLMVFLFAYMLELLMARIKRRLKI